MPQQKNKKIFIYIFLFLIIGTFNNKNLLKIDLGNINDIYVKGLDEKNNFELTKNLNFLENTNIFFLDKYKVNTIIEKNNMVENYSAFKIYPSQLKIEIVKTNFLARFKKNGKFFFFRIKW